MEFRLLGPVEVLDDSGQRIELAANRLRVLLAALLLQPNRVVAGQELMDTLWEEDLPARPRAALQTYISRLRTLLGGNPVIRTEPAGYVISVDENQVDLVRFRRLVSASTVTADPAERTRLLTEALALWRGEPLAGLTAGALIRDAVPMLAEERLHATELLLTARLERGDHAAVTSELRGLTRRHSLRESLWALLMQAQIRAGRPADALATFSEASRLLADELGLDPGPALRRLHQTVLATDARAAAVRTAREVIPHQLPTVGRTFVGRSRELDQLDKALLGLTGSIAVISGTAGVGKTALAVRWAERATAEFPDGQLYVNLRGFDPSGDLVSPEDAVRGFLDALQTAPGRIPSGAAAQAALYRTLLADRRLLIVLDNARSAAQVRPLLPGGNGCRVVVTSRSTLPGLLASEGAYPLTLDLMDWDQARALLEGAVGAQRLDAEPDAAEELVELAARLPLALSLVAAHAAAHPTWSLDAVATDLRRTRQGLDVFAGEDQATDLRAVFSWSYQLVTSTSARIFRLSGVHPGPDLSVGAAAALAGTTPDRVRPALAELERAHLVSQPSPQRYSAHDLLHVYAGELAKAQENQHEAIRRLLDYYLRTADAGDQWLRPHRDPDQLPEQGRPAYVQGFSGYQEAFDWFEVEHPNLVCLVEYAARHGFDGHATHLARTMTGFLERRGLWNTWVDVMQTAVEACERTGDLPGQVMARRYRAHALARQIRLEEALVEAETSLHLAVETGDQLAVAWCHRMVAFVLAQQERLKESYEYDQVASDLFKVVGHRMGHALALNSLGWLQASAFGDYDQALVLCKEAQALYRKVDHKLGEAATWDHLGYAYRGLTDYTQAIHCYEQALALYRELNDVYYQALMLQNLGDVQHQLADNDAAGTSWQAALSLLNQLNHPAAEAVDSRLAELCSSPRPGSPGP